ncbi:multicopper oxidase domain-containing protein (plasmid) [Paraburkholderia sp. PREW-6R]|uniref:multicopper oxidase family protein n=1 Tax=Paraburkholderia sp. PREW-6R TaxID=3141544 RepID=UPI0031F4D44C
MRSIRWFAALLACVASCGWLTAFAQPISGDTRSFVDLGNPKAALGVAEATLFARPDCGVSVFPVNGTTSVTLNVSYATYRLYNPSTDAYDTLNMRAYNGCPLGTTVNVTPGGTLNVHVANHLPPESVATCPPDAPHDTPHCFNTVNLHTHGMHVSPSGHSDNVFVALPPGTSFDYSYQIPRNHPAGTFWYHSHSHGSTAIDVSSGLEGVLIVRGNRTAAQRAANDGIADIDTILHGAQTKAAFREHVLMFQQVEYGCFDNASPSAAPLADPTTFEWICPRGTVGELRNYSHQLNFVADPRPGHAGQFNTTWAISGRYTQINGKVQPVFPSTHERVPAGEIQRLRLVHGGNRDTINVKIVRAIVAPTEASNDAYEDSHLDSTTAQAMSLLAGNRSKASQATTLDTLCSGEVVKQVEIAVDGLTRNAMVEKDVTTLNPGYRSDVLVAFPRPGLYCILDEAAEASTTINYRPNAGNVKDRRLLSFARVGTGTDIPDYATDGAGHTKYWQYVRNRLVEANSDLPADVLADLRHLDTHVFAPHKPIEGPVHVKTPTTFDVAVTNGALQFMIDGHTYDPSRVDYAATLGTADEWQLTATAAGGHVFHIHVNPFEVIDIRNASGKSIFDTSGACTADEIATGDLEYCALHGVFLDTLFLKPGYTVLTRTRYEDFTGEFVMHCHILDHEDAGMMQNIEVLSPANALISRLTTPIAAAGARVQSWMRQAAGKRPDIDLALNAPICRAGNRVQVATQP